MDSLVIYHRGGPIQTAHPGPFTCSQSICSDTACADNSLDFSVSRKSCKGMTFLSCDGDSAVFLYMSCTCTEDFVNCDDNGAVNDEGSPSVDGTGGYAAATTIVRKLGGSASIQTAGSIDLATQTAPVIQTRGSGNQDTHTAMATLTVPTSSIPMGAANKHFGDGR